MEPMHRSAPTTTVPTVYMRREEKVTAMARLVVTACMEPEVLGLEAESELWAQAGPAFSVLEVMEPG
jgi:hypothetical protein